MKLNLLTMGERARIVSLDSGNPAYRKRLLTMGLTKGTEFTLKRTAPLGDPIEIEVRGYSLILRKKEAEIINIQKV